MYVHYFIFQDIYLVKDWNDLNTLKTTNGWLWCDCGDFQTVWLQHTAQYVISLLCYDPEGTLFKPSHLSYVDGITSDSYSAWTNWVFLSLMNMTLVRTQVNPYLWTYIYAVCVSGFCDLSLTNLFHTSLTNWVSERFPAYRETCEYIKRLKLKVTAGSDQCLRGEDTFRLRKSDTRWWLDLFFFSSYWKIPETQNWWNLQQLTTTVYLFSCSFIGSVFCPRSAYCRPDVYSTVPHT